MLISIVLGYGVMALLSRVIQVIFSFFTLLLSPISSLVQIWAELDKIKQQNRESDAELERLRHQNEQFASKLAYLNCHVEFLRNSKAKTCTPPTEISNHETQRPRKIVTSTPIQPSIRNPRMEVKNHFSPQFTAIKPYRIQPSHDSTNDKDAPNSITFDDSQLANQDLGKTLTSAPQHNQYGTSIPNHDSPSMSMSLAHVQAELHKLHEDMKNLRYQNEQLASKVTVLNCEKLLLQKAKQQEIAIRDKEYVPKSEMERLNEIHKLEIGQIKRKQWCAYCSKEAVYFCCWNCSYCSTDCQQIHWPLEHKRVCKRIQRNQRI